MRSHAGWRAHARVRAADPGRVRGRHPRRHAAAHVAARSARAAGGPLGPRRGGGLPGRPEALRQGLL